MSDPLDDPRATDLLAALPDDVSTLAAKFRAAAGESAMTAAGLSAAQHDGTWIGTAAEAFRRAIGRLPRELYRVRAGYSAVADALTAYEPELSRVQAAFTQVVAERNDALSRLGHAQTAVQAAHGALVSTQQAKHVERRAMIAAELAVARASGTLDGYQSELVRLTGRAFALLDEFSVARDACRDSVAAAQRTAPLRPHSDQGTTIIAASGQPAATAAGRLSFSPGHESAANRPSSPAQKRIDAMIHHADALLGTPYTYGGGHSGWEDGGGLDCSGFVSAVLRSGGYLNTPVTTEGLMGQPDLAGGAGRYVTIYDRTGCGPNEHVIINLHGHFYESGGGSASGGAPFVHRFSPSAAYLGSFNTVLHPVGL
jgi:cell wall-associated NlpC family hydrolase